MAAPNRALCAGSISKAAVPALLSLVLSVACSQAPLLKTVEAKKPVLTLMSMSDNGADFRFLLQTLEKYRANTGLQTKALGGFDSVDTRLRVLQNLFAKRSQLPDICEIDNIWPGLLGDDLVDLKPYLGDEIAAVDHELLEAFTVKGRLVAMPTYIEIPVLYYRTDLLRKYGYPHPPRTWDELTAMAKAIQTKERKGGAKNFWGYAWEGSEGEALNCNALEWQQAEGAKLIDNSGAVCPVTAEAEAAIRRARSWVGTISPATVVEYDEEDVGNLWLAGSAAFARGWLSLYEPSKEPQALAGRFAIAPLPAGRGASAWTFGGAALAVSRYSAHPEAAIQVVLYLASASVQAQRLAASSTVPSRTKLLNDSALMRGTPFDSWIRQRWREGLLFRPSGVAGKKYDAVSHVYSRAVHEAISGKQETRQALNQMHDQLVAIMGDNSR